MTTAVRSRNRRERTARDDAWDAIQAERRKCLEGHEGERFVCPSIVGNFGSIAVAPCPSTPGHWRATHVYPLGTPAGHRTHETWDLAVRSAVSEFFADLKRASWRGRPPTSCRDDGEPS